TFWRVFIGNWAKQTIARGRWKCSHVLTTRITSSKECDATLLNPGRRQEPALERSVSSRSGRVQSRREFFKFVSRAGALMAFAPHFPLFTAATVSSQPVVFTDVTMSAGLSH